MTGLVPGDCSCALSVRNGAFPSFWEVVSSLRFNWLLAEPVRKGSGFGFVPISALCRIHGVLPPAGRAEVQGFPFPYEGR